MSPFPVTQPVFIYAVLLRSAYNQPYRINDRLTLDQDNPAILECVKTQWADQTRYAVVAHYMERIVNNKHVAEI